MDHLTGGPAPAATAEMLREVNAAHGRVYELVRPLLGGLQSQVWLIHDDTGDAVLKWSQHRDWAEQIQRADRAVALVRQRGYPTPSWLAVGVSSSGFGYQVQQHLAGRRRERLTVKAAQSAIAVLESQTGLDPDPGRSWSGYVTSCFRTWASITEEVTATGAAGAELGAQAAELLRPYEMPSFPHTDLVHGDFRMGNIVFVDDLISGVIDIEALGSGTRAFDYATLLDHEPADDAAIELLAAAGRDVAGSAVLAYCVAHVVVDLALFVRSGLSGADPEVDRRIRALSARVRLVSRLIG